MSNSTPTSRISTDLRICDFKPSNKVRDLIDLSAGSNVFGAARTFNDVSATCDAQIEYLMEQDSVELDTAALRKEATEKLAARKSIMVLFQQASGGHHPVAFDLHKVIKNLFVWGPWAKYQAYEHLTYKQKDEIDEAGSVEEFMRNEFTKIILEELDEAYTYGQEKHRILSTMLQICLDPTFEELPWLLDQMGHGHVALLEDAELKFNNRGSVYIQGYGYSHPVLGDGRAETSPSVRDAGMTTSNLVKIWPNRMIARTESRFYLAPNEIKCKDRISQILDPALSERAFSSTYEFLSEYESEGCSFGDAGYSTDKKERDQYVDIARRLEDAWRLRIEETAGGGANLSFLVNTKH